MLPVHTPLWQSVGAEHESPVAQLLPQLPPQSISVSVPFCTPSLQVGAWQTFEVHTPLSQSPPTAQPWPTVHGEQVPPPQSTSVSAPFCTVSLQFGA